MSPSQAAKRIGCSKQHVLWLIRNEKLPAEMQTLGACQQYVIQPSDVEKARRAWKKQPVKRGPKPK